MVVCTNFEPPTEGIRHRQPNTQAFISTKDYGQGTLYICESRISWQAENGSGFSLEYLHVQLHAVTRDPSLTSVPCLYLVVEGNLLEGQQEGRNGNGTNADSDDDDDDDDDGEENYPTTGIRFIPDTDTVLESMYKAMSDCQALHPDPGSDSDPDDEEEDEYNIDEAEQEQGVDQNEHGDNDEPMDGQFDDADH